MAESDGFIAGLQKIVDHGPNASRYNLVVLGDGYASSELAKFAADADAFTMTLRTAPPFDKLWPGINIHRIDVVSTNSGVKDPITCGDRSPGSGTAPKTYFDATFCGDGEIRRLLTCNSVLAARTAVSQVPEVHMTMVIVNTTEYGGSGGQVATFSTNLQAAEIGLHEMGHTAFSFADEYEYYSGCDSGERGHDHYAGGEPAEPNVTANANVKTIKWRSVLTHAADGLPTTKNAVVARCDSQPNPKSANYVGAYDGARYFHSGCYRPSFNCRMRGLGNSFCGVCQSVISETLKPFVPVTLVTIDEGQKKET